MPRMSIDDRAGRDPRFLHLAKLQGWTLREVRGCIVFEVWSLCYDRATPYLRRLDIELATGSDSLAQNMIAAGLATETRHGLRIAGASERIEYLLRAKAAGRAGGKASGKSRASNEPSRVPRTTVQGSANPPDTPTASAPDAATDLATPQERESADAPSAPPRSRVVGKLKGVTESEESQAADVLERLSQRSGRQYGKSTKHQALVISRLRAGFTVWDLRRVIGYCAIELDWESKPNMQPFLRPETLFGPEAMEKYIYAARAWLPQDEPTDDPRQTQSQTENVQPRANGGPSQAHDNVIPIRWPHETSNDLTDPAFEEPPWMTTMTPK